MLRQRQATRRRGDRIHARIYPTIEADSRSVWTRNDAYNFSDNFEKFKPVHLRVEHDKSPDGVVGEVLDCGFDERTGWMVGNCQVFDQHLLDKIHSGDIDDVSFSFTETPSHLNPLEVSLVDKPFFKDAKILSSFDSSGRRELILSAANSKYFINEMESQPQSSLAPVAEPANNSQELAEQIMGQQSNVNDLPSTNEQLVRMSMSEQQRAAFDAMSDADKAKFMGQTMRDLDEKSTRLAQFEAREAERARAEAEARLNSVRPLVDRIAARTMRKDLPAREAEAAKIGLARMLTSEGTQWIAGMCEGIFAENERNAQLIAQMQKEMAETRDLMQRTQAANQAGLRFPTPQAPVQHAYSQQAALAAQQQPTNMSASFDRLFSVFSPSSSSGSTPSSLSAAPPSFQQYEQPIQHDYSARGIKRDLSGAPSAPREEPVPKTAFAARVFRNLQSATQVSDDKRGRLEENDEIVHEYSQKLGAIVTGGAKSDRETFVSDVITANITGVVREQQMVKRGNPQVFEQSWASKYPREFDELIGAMNHRDGPPPTNISAGIIGFKEWQEMSPHERRRHPEYAFYDAPGFAATYGYNLEVSDRHAKRQRS